MKRGFTLIELLVVIAIIAVLATTAVFALAGVNQQAQRSRAEATLTQLESAIGSYKTLYGRWPIDAPLVAPKLSEDDTNKLINAGLNKCILRNLKCDWGLGSFNAFSPDAVCLDATDGREFLADPWSRPLEFKVRVRTVNAIEQVTVVIAYSAGTDGGDDWLDLQKWLNQPGNAWPPSDRYQQELRLRAPGNVNEDNIYPPAH